MRILEKGEDKVYIKRCGKCNALIEFEIEDVSVNIHFGSFYSYCPLCGNLISVTYRDLVDRQEDSHKNIITECLQDIKS